MPEDSVLPHAVLTVPQPLIAVTLQVSVNCFFLRKVFKTADRHLRFIVWVIDIALFLCGGEQCYISNKHSEMSIDIHIL